MPLYIWDCCLMGNEWTNQKAKAHNYPGVIGDQKDMGLGSWLLRSRGVFTNR